VEICEVNWGNFQAKFNGKEQESFELLCYQLFCSEFGIDIGIRGYKNQIGIETDPIEKGEDVIGWQAKFIETSIKKQKQELKKNIRAAKTKNKALTKILLYVNKEFSESSDEDKKDPDYIAEIENDADSLGVKVEWRLPNHFKRQLSLEQNARLAQHFFSLGKSIVDFISELCEHTESLLNPIHSKIFFHDAEIKIDRALTLEKLRDAFLRVQLVILSGVGGTGKTALIKDLYEELKDLVPFFVFKGSEFNVNTLEEFFSRYGPFNFADLLAEHRAAEEKFIVVDSAEALSEIETKGVFQEFVTRLIKDGWRVIFTIRDYYLDDLTWELTEASSICAFQAIPIEKISKPKIIKLGTEFGFILPQNERFLELLCAPFYLNLYLQSYESGRELETYSEFKKLIWNIKIQKSSFTKNNIHIRREECFLKISEIRGDAGDFCVKIDTDDCSNEALSGLQSDEIIKYDSDNQCYFVTHDIYEEWALGKIIEAKFNASHNTRDFLHSLSTSFPFRRAFRNWLSEQLIADAAQVNTLIEESIKDDQIESFWQDEVLVSVLLSDYASNFFQHFEKKFLADNEKLLMRVIFLLRLACKQIDETLLQRSKLEESEEIAYERIFSTPKGMGWELTIDFLYRHKEEICLRNIDTVLPLLDDWNTKNVVGESTKKASQIGLFCYDLISAHNGFKFSRNGTKNQIIRIILQGSEEIKNELSQIFEDILAKKTINYRDKYYDIVKTALCSLWDCSEAVKALPEYIIKLADLCWFRVPGGEYGLSGIAEQYFCLAGHDFTYFPASAYQTPILQLLQQSPKITADFVISFTNKAVDCFAKSEFKSEVKEIELVFDDGAVVTQFICDRLWNTYRGTKGSTPLLESIHMALERSLLEWAKTAPAEILEWECERILKNSKSASLTAVVESIVLSQPDKLFNVAKILFRTKELFLYDTARWLQDKRPMVPLTFGDLESKIYRNERIKANDADHRKLSLERIALYYQLKNFANQREIVWAIWDEHYKTLPPEPDQTDDDRTWRIFLARMDCRKRKWVPQEDGTLVGLPELDSQLKKYSNDSSQKTGGLLKFMPLKHWSESRFVRERDTYKEYSQYEKDPHLAFAETKEIADLLAKGANKDFVLCNYSIPAYACAVLIRDFAEVLTDAEMNFCRDIIIDFSSFPLRERYSYQISDGVEPAILSLPLLAKHFPAIKINLKMRLLLLLLNSYSQIARFATNAVLNDLWNICYEDAQSIFVGFLVLQPKCRDLIDELQKETFKRNVYQISQYEIYNEFQRRYQKDLEKVASNVILYDSVGDLTELGLSGLNTAFEMLPLGTDNRVHKMFLASMFPIFAECMLSDYRQCKYEKNIDYQVRPRFFTKFAHFVLSSSKQAIPGYLQPFVRHFADSNGTVDLLQAFIEAENSLERYEEFWVVWNTLYDSFVAICKTGYFRLHAAAIIHNYLLAWPFWGAGIKEWHSLREGDKDFFQKVATEVGRYPPVFYSLCKILNDIGSQFLEYGIIWLSEIIQRTPNLFSDELDTNTIYYLENLVRKDVLIHRHKIKTIKRIKDAVVTILTFLVERGSIIGYRLREVVL